MSTRNQPLKRSQPKRDWSNAEIKRGPCRVCGRSNTDLAHTFGQAFQDEKKIGPRGGEYLWVNPDSVIPLCRSWVRERRDGLWVSAGHHLEYDARKLSLIGYLTFAELRNIIRAVGKHRARRRLSGRRDD